MEELKNESVSFTAFNLDVLLDQIIRRTREIIPFDSGGIAIYDASAELLVPRIYHLADPQAAPPPLIHLGEGIIGFAAQTRQPMRMDDLPYNEHSVSYDKAARSQLAVPLVLGDELLGVFSAESHEVRAYTAHHLSILRALADQAALAVHTARLYETLANRYERLNAHNEQLILRNEISHMATSEQPIMAALPAMAKRLARLISADACLFTLWGEAEGVVTALASHGFDSSPTLIETLAQSPARSLTHEVVQSRQLIIFNQTEATTMLNAQVGVRAILAMPLVARGHPIGAALLVNLSSNGAFSQNDADTVASVLDQIALAIDNGLLQRDTEARLTETAVLLEIASIASSRLELDEMLRQVLHLSQKMLGVSAGAVLIYDRHTNMLRPLTNAAFGFSAEVLRSRFPVADYNSRIAVAFSSGTGILTNDLVHSTHADYQLLAVMTGVNNLLIVPMRIQDEPIGVIVLGGKRDDFTKTDLNLVLAMGSHIAAAMRNAELLNEMLKRLRETEALQHIAAITSATLDLDELLERAIAEAAELIEVEGAFLLLPEAGGTLLMAHARSLYGIARAMALPAVRTDSGWPVASVYRSGQPNVSNEAQTDPFIQGRSVLYYPINVRNRTLAVLSLVNRQDGDFEDSHSELVRAIASQIAISMENAGLYTAEHQRADLMSLINTIGGELTATLDLSGLAYKAVRAIREMLGYDAACIYLLDADEQTYTAKASAASRPALHIPEGQPFALSQGIVGRAIRTGETQLVFNVQSDTDLFWPGGPQYPVSDLVVVLRNRERILGAIEILSLHQGAFGDPDRTALETLATQISTVIENARLWDQAQHRLLEQSIVHQIGQDLGSILDYSELVNAVVRHMTRALDTAICWLISYNSDNTQLLVEAEYRVFSAAASPMPRLTNQPPSPIEHALINEAVSTRRHALVYRGATRNRDQQTWFDQIGITTELVLPMVAGDRVVGCMMWIETRDVRTFSDADIRLAQTLTAQAAIAIENARLYRQAQRQAREQALLRRVATNLIALTDVNQLLAQFSQEVRPAIAADNVLVLMRDSDTIFRVKAESLTTQPREQLVLGRLMRELPQTWDVLRVGLLVHASSALPVETRVQAEIRDLMKDTPYMVAIVPIRRRGETIGLIEVARDDPHRLFESHDLALLESLVNQGAIAIDNVSLNEREQRRLRQLEKVQASSRLLSGQLNMNALHSLIVSEAAAIFEADAVNLIVPLEGDRGHYISRASFGLSAEYLAERHVEIVTSSRERATYLPDMKVSLDGTQHAIALREHLHSALLAPINKADQHLGMLVLYSKNAVRSFFEEKIDLALLFAGQAAVALDNADLFQRLEDRAIELMKANRLKSEFLARVSHELRTPMNSINGYSELLLLAKYGAINDVQSDRLERILRNGRNLLALIDDLLDISKIDAGKVELRLEAINLRDELNATIFTMETQATARGLYLSVRLPDDLPPVRADVARLRQIITNLLGNAIKFTKTGGITIDAEILEEDGLLVVCTRISDTGIGIKSEDQELIFDEFRQVDGGATREYGGTGLGLAITRKLLEMMSGRIWVESELGHGSSFAFVLPVVASAVGQANPN